MPFLAALVVALLMQAPVAAATFFPNALSENPDLIKEAEILLDQFNAIDEKALRPVLTRDAVARLIAGAKVSERSLEEVLEVYDEIRKESGAGDDPEEASALTEAVVVSARSAAELMNLFRLIERLTAPPGSMPEVVLAGGAAISGLSPDELISIYWKSLKFPYALPRWLGSAWLTIAAERSKTSPQDIRTLYDSALSWRLSEDLTAEVVAAAALSGKPVTDIMSIIEKLRHAPKAPASDSSSVILARSIALADARRLKSTHLSRRLQPIQLPDAGEIGAAEKVFKFDWYGMTKQ